MSAPILTFLSALSQYVKRKHKFKFHSLACFHTVSGITITVMFTPALLPTSQVISLHRTPLFLCFMGGSFISSSMGVICCK